MLEKISALYPRILLLSCFYFVLELFVLYIFFSSDGIIITDSRSLFFRVEDILSFFVTTVLIFSSVIFAFSSSKKIINERSFKALNLTTWISLLAAAFVIVWTLLSIVLIRT